MGSLPQLIDEDLSRIHQAFAVFLSESEARCVLLLAEGGFLVCSEGDCNGLDLTSIGALASNSFEANRMMASMIGETNFESAYQAGEQLSMYIQSIDGFNLLVVIFPVQIAVGMIKYYAQAARQRISEVFTAARQRSPAGLDLALMNVADSSQIFKRRTD